MGRSDPALTYLKQYGFSVVRLPRADIPPGLLLEREGRELLDLGGLETVFLKGDTDPPTVRRDEPAAQFSGEIRTTLSLGLGLSLLEQFLRAFGGSTVGLEAQFQGARSLTFEFDEVFTDSIEPAALEKFLARADVDPRSVNARRLLDEDKVYVVTRTLKAKRFLLEGQKEKARGDMNAARVQMDHRQSEIDQLGTRQGLLAPRAGIVLGAPKKDEVNKEWLRDQSLPFCEIGDPTKLLVLVPVSPHDYQVLRSDLEAEGELQVSIRIPGRRSEVIMGKVTRLPASDAKDVPVGLTHRGGGPLAVKPATADPNVNVPQSQQYLIQVELPQPDDAIVPGTLVSVKIHCRWRTCAWWVWHAISSAFDIGLI